MANTDPLGLDAPVQVKRNDPLGFEDVKKNPSTPVSPSGGQPSSNGGLTALVSPQSGKLPNPTAPIQQSNPVEQAGIHKLDAIANTQAHIGQVKQDLYPKQLRPDVKAMYDKMPKEQQQDFIKSPEFNLTQLDDLKNMTPDDMKHWQYMNETKMGKTLGVAAYLGRQATKGSLAVLKGVSHLANHAFNNGAQAQLGDMATEGVFDTADKHTNMGLTKGDIKNAESGTIESGAGQIAYALPAILGGEATGATKAVFGLQGVGNAVTELEDAEKNGTKVSPLVKQVYPLASGILNGYLMGDVGETMFAKLPNSVRSGIARNLVIDAVKDAGGKEVTPEILQSAAQKFMGNVKQRGIGYLKNYARTTADLSVLNSANWALQKGADTVSDKPIFNNNDFVGGIGQAAKSAIGFALPGAFTKLLPYSEGKDQITQEIYNKPTDDNVASIKQEITDHAEKQGWTPVETQQTLDHVDNIHSAVKQLPDNISPEKRGQAVDLLMSKNDLQGQLDELTKGKERLDPALKDITSPNEQLITDKIDQANDKLRSIVTGDKTTYSKGVGEEEGKFFKTTAGQLEEISPNRYELENLERTSKQQNNENSNEKNGEESSQEESSQSSSENGSSEEDGLGKENDVNTMGEASAEPITNDEDNAVQKQSTGEVHVQPASDNSEKVGKGNQEPKGTPEEGQKEKPRFKIKGNEITPLPPKEHAELESHLLDDGVTIQDLQDEQQERNATSDNSKKTGTNAETVQQPENDGAGNDGEHSTGESAENGKGSGERLNGEGGDEPPKAKNSEWLEEHQIDRRWGNPIIGRTENFYIHDGDGKLLFRFRDWDADEKNKFDPVEVQVDKGDNNRIHIDGLSKKLRGKGYGKEIYKSLIDKYGIISTSTFSSSKEAKRVWDSLKNSGKYHWAEVSDGKGTSFKAVSDNEKDIDKFIKDKQNKFENIVDRGAPDNYKKPKEDILTKTVQQPENDGAGNDGEHSTGESAENGKGSGEAKQVKKTILTQRAYEGEIHPEVKKHLEDKGLTRSTFTQPERSKQATDFINKFGEDAAYHAVNSGDVDGGLAASILAQLQIRNSHAIEDASPENIDDLAKKQADLIALMEKKGYLGGEFNGQLAHEYQNEELNYANVKRQVEKATDKPLTKDQEKKVKELSDKNEALKKQVEETEAKLIEETNKAFEQGKEAAKDETKSQKAKRIADKIRAGKIHKGSMFSAASPASLVWDTAIELTAKSVEAGGKLADAIQAGLDHIKSSDWYKSLSDKKKEQAENEYKEYHISSSTSTDLSDLQQRFADKKDNKFTPNEAKSIWGYMRENYIDKGTPYRDAISKTSEDLGLSWRQISEAIVTPKLKRSSDEMWKKQADLARNRAVVKDWITDQNKSTAWKALQKVSGLFRGVAVFGHGGIFVGTHAGMTLFDPATAGKTVRAFLNGWKFAYGNEANYEKSMEELKNSPNYVIAQRAGLNNNPERMNAEEYQRSQKYLGKLGIAGERGFNAIKILRQGLFDHYYERLTPAERDDPEVAKSIAKLTNLATGATNLKLPSWVNEVTFAGGMEASRWGKLTSSPLKATGVAIKALTNPESASAADRVFAKVWARRVGTELAVFTGAVGANAVLQNKINPNNPVNMTNPNKSDFMKFKFGDLTIDPTSGMLSTASFLHEIGKIPFERQKDLHGDKRINAIGKDAAGYARGKLSPMYGTIADVISHQDFSGNTLPWNSDKPAKGGHKLTVPEYAGSKLPLPIAEALNVAYKSAIDHGAKSPSVKDVMKGLISGAISGSTGFRVSEQKKKGLGKYIDK